MKKMMMNRLLIVTILAAAVSCGPGVTLTKEDRKLPDQYIGLDRNDTTTIAKLHWKEYFRDTLLQGYISTALENNYSFRIAMERVNIASNEIRVARGAYFPSASFGAGAGVERFGRYTLDGIDMTGLPDPYSDFSLGITFQWEVDIWGKITKKKQAAMHRWMASSEAVRLSQSYIIREVANNYFRLIGLDYFRNVIEEYIKDTEKSCELTAELKNSGEETQLAVDQFNARLYYLKGMLLNNEAEIMATERAMSLLMGVLPQSIDRISFEELQEIQFRREIGVPVELLQYRPDILIAESELMAAECDAEAAKKAFFPTLSLAGGGGFNAFDAAFLFTSPASLVFSLAAGLTAPIFQSGRIKANWENAKSEQIIALNNYFQTVLSAYQEVVRVVSELQFTQEQQILKENEMQSYKDASENAMELFHLQYASYLEVLSAEEKYFDCRLDYMELQMKYCRLIVDLYRSLGGGAIVIAE